MRLVSFAVVGSLSLLSVVGRAQTNAPAEPQAPPGAGAPAGYPPPAAESPAAGKKLGVGYKIGNGLGFLGADIVVAPIEHVAVDLQVNYFSASQPNGTAHGFGFAPAVQGRLNGGQRSTPYLGLGLAHISLTLDNVTASGTAVFANLGYEWRWDSGLGILLGGGIAHLGTITASDQVTTISRKGGWLPNLEFGVRYMFL